ncbi:MAG: GFA family protein [Alphaproteobacteria bacterium]|nr:GFA family protein [Alphaproteobacteria bacterium]
MHVDGECHCGAIAWSAEVDPGQAGLCHCTDCQAFSGAPFRASVPASKDEFRLLRGHPRIYVKTADSGARRAQAFCGECGTPIYATSPDKPVTYNLRLGAIRQRADIVPRRQIWCSSALEWAKDIRAIPSM